MRGRDGRRTLGSKHSVDDPKLMRSSGSVPCWWPLPVSDDSDSVSSYSKRGDRAYY